MQPANDLSRPAVHHNPDHRAIAQELQRVNRARVVQLEAQILCARHRWHDPPLDLVLRQDAAVATRIIDAHLVAATLSAGIIDNGSRTGERENGKRKKKGHLHSGGIGGAR